MAAQHPTFRACLIHSESTRRHVMIQRMARTFAAAGIAVTLIDQDSNPSGSDHGGFCYVRRSQVDWKGPTTVAWKLLRRIPSAVLKARFWWTALWIRSLTNAIRLAMASMGEPADCLIACDLVSALGALMASRLRRRPVIYCAFEMEAEQGEPDEARRSALHSLEALVVPRVDYLVTPNRPRAALYQDRYGTRNEPIVILNCPPTVDVPNRDRIRAALGLPASTRIVLYHGAMIPFRALDNLIQSAALFDPDVALVLMGQPGEYFKSVLAPILEQDQLRTRVFTLPFVTPEEVAPFVASADLGVVIYENVNLNNYYCAPMKLYEYLMMRVPFVGSDFPEIADLVREYQVGFTFNPADPVSIAEAVNSYFRKNDAERAEISEALARARTQFSWENEGWKWLTSLRLATKAERDPAKGAVAT